MQKITCTACGRDYWVKSLSSEKRCPSCGGTGEKKELPCTECGGVIPKTNHQYPRLTCSKSCALDREARLAREAREKRGLKRKPTSTSFDDAKGLDAPLTKKRKCHDCPAETWDHRCPACLRIWRKGGGASGSNQITDLFSAGRCYAEVGA